MDTYKTLKGLIKLGFKIRQVTGSSICTYTVVELKHNNMAISEISINLNEKVKRRSNVFFFLKTIRSNLSISDNSSFIFRVWG